MISHSSVQGVTNFSQLHKILEDINPNVSSKQIKTARVLFCKRSKLNLFKEKFKKYSDVNLNICRLYKLKEAITHLCPFLGFGMCGIACAYI